MIVIIMLIAIIFDSLIYFMLSNIYDGKISCRREFNQLLKIFFYKQNADKNVEDVKETSIKEINLKQFIYYIYLINIYNSTRLGNLKDIEKIKRILEIEFFLVVTKKEK